MKATELRIGNYVSYIGNETRVTVISDGFVSTLKSAPLTYNQVAPIPLTEEWLLKLGFFKDYDDDASWFEFHDFPVIGDLCTADSMEYVFDVDQDKLRLKYVHQLQNLYFALTGKELEVKS